MANLFSGLFSRRRVAPTLPAGTSDLRVIGGYVQDGEKNAQLVGRNKWTSYRQILVNTSVVAAGVRHFVNLCGGISLLIEPPDGVDAKADELADLVRDMLDDMQTPWRRVQRRMATFTFFGFHLEEWISKRRPDGVIGLADVQRRPHHTIERWDVDSDTGEIYGVEQRSSVTGETRYVPRKKLIYLVSDELTESPEGLGILRQVYPSSQRLARYEQLEGLALETDLRGIPVGSAPLAELAARGLTDAQISEQVAPMADILENHVRGKSTSLMIDSSVYRSKDDAQAPSGVAKWKLELLSASGEAQTELAAAISREDHRIARILGVEHMLLGENRGTQALSQDKTSMFRLMIDSTMATVAEVVQHELVWPLWQLNGWDPKYFPRVVPEPVRLESVEEITAALRDMAQAGAMLLPDDPVINEVRDRLGVSHAPEMDSDASLMPRAGYAQDQKQVSDVAGLDDGGDSMGGA